MTGILSPDERARLEQLFDEAAELPAAEHAAFVDRECGEHGLLREKLSRLLRGLAGDDLVGSRVPGTALPAGTRIGRYELGERLGEGGMGEVYAARQLEPVVRDVALKLIKPGMDSAQVVRRFEAERQALARMAHPAVAQVFDGGITEQGRPYFVMERVRGPSITEHCDRGALSTRARLELFLELCAGVLHAHQKGVIHRDLKPSNLLVSTVDGRPVPKIIDFGVARATTGSLAEGTFHTVLGQLVGTLDYMSPEQADPVAADVDVRSDVYSLGVVLYQLVSGLLPFDHGSELDRPLSEVQRAIREEEPPTPSTRLRRDTDEATAVAPRHATDHQGLIRQVSGDLDWICLKALEKDPARRYQSVAELADDLRRHLDHQPVLAHRPSAPYRLRKFVRRHRVGVMLSVLAVLAVGGTGYGVVRSIIGAEVERAFLVLSELQKAEALIAQAGELWPATPERLPDFDAWSQEAQGMLARQGQYRRELAELRARALPWTEEERAHDRQSHPQRQQLSAFRVQLVNLTDRLENPNVNPDKRPKFERRRDELEAQVAQLEAETGQRRTYRFASADDEWKCRWMGQLVEVLDDLQDAETGLQSPGGVSPEHGWSVPRRRAHARWLGEMERTEAFAARWEEARAAILEHPDYGFDLAPQRGLLPLGVDELSGLWEFAHLSSGEAAVRGEDGLLVLSPQTGIVLVLIPPGGFEMGTAGPNPRTWPKDIQDPQQLEHLTHFESAPGGRTLEVPEVPPFFLSKVEMTRAQWERMTVGPRSKAQEQEEQQEQEQGEQEDGQGAPGPSSSRQENPDPLLPIDQVSWTDCDRVTRWMGLALPTEVQWEYATRAGTTTSWWTGDDAASLWESGLDEHFPLCAANLFDQSNDRVFPSWKARLQVLPAAGDDGFAFLRPIGLGARNPFGLHDVHGNASEWCRNPPYNYGTSPPEDAPADSSRTSRGGSNRDSAYWLRSAARREGSPELAAPAYGLRPSRELDG